MKKYYLRRMALIAAVAMPILAFATGSTVFGLNGEDLKHNFKHKTRSMMVNKSKNSYTAGLAGPLKDGTFGIGGYTVIPVTSTELSSTTQPGDVGMSFGERKAKRIFDDGTGNPFTGEINETGWVEDTALAN